MRISECTPIRILIADGFPVVRTGLITTIETEPQMRVVDSARHREELIPRLKATCVDVVVINVVGMGDAPVTLLPEIRQLHFCVGIVGFAARVDSAPELLAAGMHAYVAYEEPDEHLRLAIRAANARQTYLSPLVQDYVDRYAMLLSQQRFAPRELEIIKYMAQGMSGHEIADCLDMGYRTVRNYVWSIRKKTGWTTWTQMVSWYCTMYGSEGSSHVLRSQT